MIFGNRSVRSTTAVQLSGIQIFMCGLIVLLFSTTTLAAIEPALNSEFFEYGSRATKLLVQKFLFFNSDILGFYVLFDCFFWGV
jgi:hypothetical protein